MGDRSAKPHRRGKRSRKTATSIHDIQGTGLPAKDSVREILTFVSPQKKRYQILRTTETDTYEPPMKQRKTQKQARRIR